MPDGVLWREEHQDPPGTADTRCEAGALTRATRARAASQGRTYATPDDVKALAVPVLSHRLILHPEAEFDGVTQEAVVGQVLLDTLPPTQRESA